MKRLKILILIRNFSAVFPKHKFKTDMVRAIEEFADVRYWTIDGDIERIIKALKFKPDFILHYDIGWSYTYAPKIEGLGSCNIPVGCFVNDIHNPRYERTSYFESVKPALIFTTYDKPFKKHFPEYAARQIWWPFGINPNVFKDWHLEKTIDYLLMGLNFDRSNEKDLRERQMWNSRYPFREKVLETMRNEDGFIYNRHPGHFAKSSEKLIVNDKYAKTINEAKIFFTCGGIDEYAVAKFFEIPACRTLMLAYPNEDVFNLGFEDGVNFVACSMDDFYEKAQFYKNHDAERQKITDAGYKFVHENHTNRIRAKQFVQAVTDFLKRM